MPATRPGAYPCTSADIFARLGALGIEFTTAEHPALHTVADSRRLRGEIPGGHCKNLFLKDKKQALWLVVTLEEAVVDLKTLPGKIGAGRLSFGKPELLMTVLGVAPGAVSPFALINDTELAVNVVLDRRMMACEQLNFHPLSNEATTTIGSSDLIRFITDCGHSPQIEAITG